MAIEISAFAFGVRHDSDGESCIAWAVFDRETVESEFGTVDRDSADYIARELTGFERFYCGPGRAFGHDPSVRLSRTRVLVTQCRGLDI